MTIFRIVRRLPACLALLAGSAALSATAAPMGYKDSWMTMADLGPNWRELSLNYALTATDALGVDEAYMRSDDKQSTLDLSDLTYTRLLHRWNSADAQANLWFVTGIGEAWTHNRVTGISETRTMWSPGTQFDYETRRVYFAAAARLYRATGIDHDYGSVRGGFSFYETEYDETQPWFVLEARRMHDLSDKTEITPMLRLINKGLFIEAGVNNSHQPRLNFMYIF
ncbi:MAG: hypothetical protein JO269_01345 [Burkholderiaceae bacterium]|nr:hypothetical protein [Burkholderiaceae bacterium]